jgi:hypothetical protein
LKEFGNLPIYDEDDEAGCDSLNPVRVGDTRYEGAFSEAEVDVQFWNLLRDARYELKGAIRYSPTDVRAIFWLKREPVMARRPRNFSRGGAAVT